MTDYGRFKKNREYARAIGLCPPCEQDVEYFCTPVGAKPIGTLGVDGVSFCFVEGLGETVFCVSPLGGVEHYVFPIARDFTEFLSLAATLGDVGTAEQIMCFERERFYGFFPLDRAVFEEKSAELAEFDLARIDDPWASVRDLCGRFNYGLLHFTDEYYSALGLPNPHGERDGGKKSGDFVSTFTLKIKK